MERVYNKFWKCFRISELLRILSNFQNHWQYCVKRRGVGKRGFFADKADNYQILFSDGISLWEAASSVPYLQSWPQWTGMIEVKKVLLCSKSILEGVLFDRHCIYIYQFQKLFSLSHMRILKAAKLDGISASFRRRNWNQIELLSTCNSGNWNQNWNRSLSITVVPVALCIATVLWKFVRDRSLSARVGSGQT